MESYSQAPMLKHNGKKDQSPHNWGKAIRTHDLEAAIFRCLGNQDYAMAKIMLFLTGNAEGFRIAEKTILERCNISESGYKGARKKLIAKGWITHKPSDFIQVNYSKIFSDYKNLRLGYTDETEEKASVKPLDKPAIPFSTNETGFSERETGFSEQTYNNINNNISNRKNNIKEIEQGSCCEKPRSVADATPQGVSQPLRERTHHYSRQERKDAEREYDEWEESEYDMSVGLFEDDEQGLAEYKESDEYKALMEKIERKRNEMIEKYGPDFSFNTRRKW